MLLFCVLLPLVLVFPAPTIAAEVDPHDRRQHQRGGYDARSPAPTRASFAHHYDLREGHPHHRLEQESEEDHSAGAIFSGAGANPRPDYLMEDRRRNDPNNCASECGKDYDDCVRGDCCENPRLLGYSCTAVCCGLIFGGSYYIRKIFDFTRNNNRPATSRPVG